MHQGCQHASKRCRKSRVGLKGTKAYAVLALNPHHLAARLFGNVRDVDADTECSRVFRRVRERPFGNVQEYLLRSVRECSGTFGRVREGSGVFGSVRDCSGVA